MSSVTDSRISVEPLFATFGVIAVAWNISEKGMWPRNPKSRLQAELTLLDCFPNLTFKLLKIRAQS